MKTPINIEIPSCLPQHPWHPSVVYVSEGWNGHRFWMAQTPYPPFHVAPYKDRWELPCIHYSDDGMHWNTIDANPIDDLTDEQMANHSYHSDPHLVMKDGVLYCYYRLMENNDAKTTILRKKSVDGIHWSDREMITFDNGKSTLDNCKLEIISPAVVWTGEKWRMYYVDDTFTNLQRGIQLAESEDGILFEVVGSVWKQQEVKPWHIDVQLIDGIYYLLIHDVDNNSLWLYTSQDGIQFGEGKEVLRVSGRLTDFWSHKLYRACLVCVDGKIHIYFSANDGMASYLGQIQQVENGSLYIVDCLNGKEKCRFVLRFWCRRCKQLVQRLMHFIEKRIK